MKTNNNDNNTVTKKIFRIKKENRKLSKRIHTIHLICYILGILSGFPIQYRIMEITEEISTMSYSAVIVITCMLFYYMCLIGVYYLLIHPSIESIKDVINHNNETIKLLKYREEEENAKIESDVRTDKIFNTINSLYEDEVDF